MKTHRRYIYVGSRRRTVPKVTPASIAAERRRDCSQGETEANTPGKILSRFSSSSDAARFEENWTYPVSWSQYLGVNRREPHGHFRTARVKDSRAPSGAERWWIGKLPANRSEASASSWLQQFIARVYVEHITQEAAWLPRSASSVR
jgi:hypothetical protein